MTNQLDAFEVFNQLTTGADSKPDSAGLIPEVLNILGSHTHKSNPITQSKIAEKLKTTSAVVRTCIMPLRHEGNFICSGPRGCWISRKDILETIEHLESRAYSELKTARLLRKAYERSTNETLEI